MPPTDFHTPNKAHFPRGPRGSYTPNKAHLSTGFRMANRTNFFSTSPHMSNGTHTSDKLPYAEREGVNRLNIV